MPNPILSIVIVNYNYGRFLEDAIKSIVEQEGFDKCELIVVDGGSTDNSVEIIKKYADKISWWCSEKDKGQSDAFNKGFARARGQMGCWLNADDIMLPQTIGRVCEYLKSHKDVQWISGGTIYFNSYDKKLLWMRKGSSSRYHYWNPGSFVGGPSSFFNLQRMRDVGGFDVKLRFTMDSDLWWKFTRIGMKNIHVKRYFWGFRIHQSSKTAYAYFSNKGDDFQKEACLLRNRHGYSGRQKAIGGILLRIVRFITGNLIVSLIDSHRWKGRTLDEFLEVMKHGEK